MPSLLSTVILVVLVVLGGGGAILALGAVLGALRPGVLDEPGGGEPPSPRWAPEEFAVLPVRAARIETPATVPERELAGSTSRS